MDQLTDIPIVILAAGSSSRMHGIDKLLNSVDGMPLIRRQVMLARSVTRGPVLVALPPPPHDRYTALADSHATLISVADADEGMNASLRAAFAAVPRDAHAAMLILGDLPDLTRNDLRTVLESMTQDALVWRGATEDGKPGHPIVFDATLFAAFADLKGDSGGQEVMRRAEGHVHLVPLQGDRARRDLDTPHDWADWRAANLDRS